MVAQVNARRNGAVICTQAKNSTAIRNREMALSKNCSCRPPGVLSGAVRGVALSNAWRGSCKSITISSAQPLTYLSANEYGMFKGLMQYPWVLKLYRYNNTKDLLTSLADMVIAPAEAKVLELQERGWNDK